MTENTLKITFGEGKEIRENARERLRRAEAGEAGETIQQDVQFLLNFETFTDVEQLMRSSNLELLKAIVDEGPESIRQTADAVGRDYKEVHRNLSELESLGVIEFVEDGGSKRPSLGAGAENIEFSFRFPPDADDKSAGLSA